jgi:Uma2 family endonuclease
MSMPTTTPLLEPLEPEVSPTRPLGPWANGVELSPEEYDAATEWEPGYRYELVKGILIVSPPAGLGERSPNDYLGFMLWKYAESHPQGKSLSFTVNEHEVQIGAQRRRMDRAIWTGFNRPVDPRRDVPTIAIEFVSDTSRDRRRDFVVKRQEYASIGIAEYWILDRFRRTLTVIQGNDMQVVKEGETYRPERLPGFEFPVSTLLARATWPDQPDEGQH